MTNSFNWECPFCGRHTTITDARRSEGRHLIDIPNKHGKVALLSAAYACPNEKCKELYLFARLAPFRRMQSGSIGYATESLETWQLRPQASVKVFPDYVPAPILEDYKEACLIRDLSPKASATLSRRCLQGMIRDYWKIAKGTLKDEIDALEGQVDTTTWEAIDAVRHIGNIGAHMEKDINLVLDVDPDEAALLIGLIETLIKEWYVASHERQERMASIKAAAEAKKQLKKQPPAAEGSGPGKKDMP